jgi:hypothetical protein
MEPLVNIYKYNLDILTNLEEGQTIYYEENKIILDERYFGSYRYGNNWIKINEIIKTCFLHYYNILQMNISEDREEILEILRNTINGLKIIINTLKTTDKEYCQVESLRLDLLSLLTELEDPENIEDKSDSDSESENCLRSMLNSTKEHLQLEDHNIIVNTIYVLKNQAVTTFFGIINFFFNMASF